MSLERDMSDMYDPAGFYDDSYRYVPTIEAQESVFDPTYGNQYSDPYANYTPDNDLVSALGKGFAALGQGLTSPRGLAGLLGMLLGGLQDRQKASGGIKLNLSPSKVTRKTLQGRYGPTTVHEFAANGGLMQAYASGGTVTGTKQNPLPMEHGGFVLTADAVRNGTPQGIRQLLPQAQLIRGPGTGTSDNIPATIAGRTPARVSNGEMYVPKAQVDRAGGARALYALMHQLQRSA
jgi:hypothetical protein